MPLDAIVFGGRRAKTAPLVYEARDWAHGVFVGSIMLFHHVDGRSATTFRVVEGGGEEDDSPPKELFTLSESQLRELAAKGKLSRTVRESVASGGKTE